jgi:lincosamide nucleotidyltransferase A/C/D/E
MSAADVVDIVDRLEGAGLTVWLDGGWGVDALLEEQTRPHDDLDLVVLLDEVPRVERELAVLGYVRVGGTPPLSFESVDADGRQVDSHPVVLDREGNGVYRMAGGRTWLYPAAGFSGTGAVAGRHVRCLTPEVQALCHEGYELDDEDRADLRLLEERFGSRE